MPSKTQAPPKTMEVKIKEQVQAYSLVQPVYEEFAAFLSATLTVALRKMGISALVSTRTKGKPNFVEKMIRKQDEYPDPIHQLNDLCGARIIVDFLNDIEPTCNFIRTYFDIDEANSEDVAERLGVSRFGYRSVHFIVALNERKIDQMFADLNLKAKGSTVQKPSKRLYTQRTPKDCERLKLMPGPVFRAEIQVRTLLQHAWAVLAHDRIYKSDFSVPDRWVRDANRVAATLENADNEFIRTIAGVEGYRNYFGAYMPCEACEKEIKKLEIVAQYDPDNLSLALQMARMANHICHWEKAREKLEPFVKAWEGSEKGTSFKSALEKIDLLESAGPDSTARMALTHFQAPKMAAAFLDLGRAMYGLGKKNLGKKYMECAVALDLGKIDATIILAKTLLLEEEITTAHDWFENAYKRNPADPMALGGFLVCKVLEQKNLDFLPLLSPGLENGIAACQERIQAGVYLPHAYYDMGLFSLMLGRPFESLNAYTAAVHKSETEAAIEEELLKISRLKKALSKTGHEKEKRHLEWLHILLLLAKTAKSAWLLKQAEKAVMKTELEIKELEKALKEEINPLEKTDLEQSLQKKREQLVNDRQAQAEKQKTAKHTRNSVLRELAAARKQRFETSKTLIIVAGGCDERITAQMNHYRPLLETAFHEYAGTIVSGGTTAGISGIIGDLPVDPDWPMRKISYLPEKMPGMAQRHPQYEVILAQGENFSPFESIQCWIDLLAAGLDLSKIKLIGINGGNISAFEYRMAVIMGAKVGILRDSGRAATDIAHDPSMNTAENLFLLPTDSQTLRVFVHELGATGRLQAQDREELARQAQAEYQKNQRKRNMQSDPSLADWDLLPPYLKASNYHQVDHIEEKLRNIGLRIEKTGKIPAAPIHLKDEEELIEKMAEMEHGRWNVERIMAGWRPGKRDVVRKTSPYLVPWNELSEEIKGYDRQAVRKNLASLSELGYRIVKIQSEE